MVPLTINEEGFWMPIEREDQPLYKYVAEFAKSSRARCRRCSDNILKGELRLGAPIKWRGGEYGWISSW